MPNFKNFANSDIEDGNSSELSSIRHKQKRDTRIGSRIERVWATDFERCESREDFEKYISKYGKYESNKYVIQAQNNIESHNTEVKNITEQKTVIHKAKQTSVHLAKSRLQDNPDKKRYLSIILRIIGGILLIGAVGLLSTVIEIAGWIKYVFIGGGLAVLKFIWSKD